MIHTLVVRLDSLGDVLVCGPAVRAVAAGSDRTTMLVGPAGAEAAALLPGVDDVIVWDCPWISAHPPEVDRAALEEVVAAVQRRGVNRAVVLTSFHQSALPTALLLRLAGVPRIAAASDDYPGSLLDVRLTSPPDAPEPVRMLEIARGAGFDLPPGDDGRLRVRAPLPPVDLALPGDADEYLVVHPGVTAEARAYPADHWRQVVAAVAALGIPVVVTGSKDETELTAFVAGEVGVDCGGRFDVAELATVLAGAAVVAVANTGPAHLAAAVGTPVVSLFAPVISPVRWAPYGARVEVLGDLTAPCHDTRATLCPVPGHPCLSGVAPCDVVSALLEVMGEPR